MQSACNISSATISCYEVRAKAGYLMHVPYTAGWPLHADLVEEKGNAVGPNLSNLDPGQGPAFL